MERPSHVPGNHWLPPEAVDVSGLKPAEVISSQIMPPSPNLARWEEYRRAAEAELEYISEQIEHDTQREAIARAALLGEQPKHWQGVHRREESVGEIARDEVATTFKRAVGRIAAFASRVGNIFTHKQRNYGKLEDIGFGEAGDNLTMRDATDFYTEEELDEIRARVMATYRSSPGSGETTL